MPLLDYSGLVTIQILLCAAGLVPETLSRFTVLACPLSSPTYLP